MRSRQGLCETECSGALALAPNAGKLFWLERASGKLWRATVEGTHVEVWMNARQINRSSPSQVTKRFGNTERPTHTQPSGMEIADIAAFGPSPGAWSCHKFSWSSFSFDHVRHTLETHPSTIKPCHLLGAAP